MPQLQVLFYGTLDIKEESSVVTVRMWSVDNITLKTTLSARGPPAQWGLDFRSGFDRPPRSCGARLYTGTRFQPGGKAGTHRQFGSNSTTSVHYHTMLLHSAGQETGLLKWRICLKSC